MKTSRLASPANPSGIVRPCPLAPPVSYGENRSPIGGTIWRFLAVALVYCALAFAATAWAAKVSWSRNAEADIVRYEVRYGQTSGVYTQTADAGNNTSVLVNDLQPGVTYYLTVVAVNEAGLESIPSTEISYAEPLDEAALVSRDGWTVRYVDSEETGGFTADKAFDGNAATFWHTRWTGGSTPTPHEIQIDLGGIQPIKGFRYLPRQDNYSVGNIAGYQFYVSLNGSDWGQPVASGTFPAGSAEKQVTFTNQNARFVRFVCVSEVNGGPDTAVAELNLLQGDPIDVPLNQPPVAEAKSVAVAEDASIAITLQAVDPDGDAMGFAVVSNPTRGTLSGSAPNLTYIPNANFNGTDSFTFRANDRGGQSNVATVSITVTPVNDAPVAQAKSVTTAEDSAVAVNLTGTDVEGTSLNYSVLSSPSKGVLSGTAPNLTFTPNANQNGADSFTYRVFDGSAYSGTATVSLTITPVNDAPVAASKSITVVSGQPFVVALSATDIEGGSLTYSVVSGPSHGVLSGAAPNLNYTSTAGYSGTDSFTFRANDGSANSNLATVSVTIKPATDGSEIISSGGWSLLYVDSEEVPNYAATRAFDGNPDTFWHTRFTSGATTQPHEIQIALGGLHQLRGFRYLPRQDSSEVGNIGGFQFHTSMDGVNWGTAAASGTFEAGRDVKEITFTARNARFIRLVGLTSADGSIHSNVAELLLLGSAISNSAPAVSDAAFAANKNSPCPVTLTATDPDGDPLSYSVVTGPANGTLSGTPPSLVYQPAAGFTGEDSFTFEASDGFLGAQAVVVIRVSGGSGGDNKAPVFRNDPIHAPAAIANVDYSGLSLDEIVEDPDTGDQIRFSKMDGPAWLKVGSNGKLSGTPPAGSSGVHRFKVTATDNAGASADAELIIEVDGGNLPLPWSMETLGGANQAGDAVRLDSGALRVSGSGKLTGASDSGTFVWQKLTGDGQIVARISSLARAGSETRVGVMIRDSLSAKSPHVFLGINDDGSCRQIIRQRQGGPQRSEKAGKSGIPDVWLKLVRSGDTVTTFKSDDGEKWRRVGSDSVKLGRTCYVGLIVSGGDGREAEAIFRDLRIKP